MRPATTISRPPAQPEGPMLSPCINTAAKNALHSGRLEKMICAWGAGTLLWPCTAYKRLSSPSKLPRTGWLCNFLVLCCHSYHSRSVTSSRLIAGRKSGQASEGRQHLFNSAVCRASRREMNWSTNSESSHHSLHDCRSLSVPGPGIYVSGMPAPGALV